jgi:hypothetical protein
VCKKATKQPRLRRNGSSPFLDSLYAARRYKASEEHLTECLIALRNSESDSHEKRDSSKSREVLDHDKRNDFLVLCRMFASRSLLGKDKDSDGGGYKTRCTSVVIQNLHS